MLWTLTLHLVHFDFCLLLPFGVVFSSWFLFLTVPFEKNYEKITVGLSFSLFWDSNFVLFFSYVLIHCENSCEYMLIHAFFLMWNILFSNPKIHKKFVLVLFYHIHLVVTNLSVKCARYLEKAFMLCLLRVPLYLWDTTSLSVRLV